jgi:signal transduction histidine kinase
MKPSHTAIAINDHWHSDLRLRIFRIALTVLIAGVSAIAIFGAIFCKTFPCADTATMLVLLIVLAVSKYHPGRMRLLAWVMVIALLIDVLDGLWPCWQTPITPTHILLPSLIVLGVVLEDLSITIVMSLAVLSIYMLTWIRFSPLSPSDQTMLVNLITSSLGLGLLSIAVWSQHRRMLTALNTQSHDLQNQLAANQRLNAVISHDINNPLTVLQTTVELANENGHATKEELDTIARMANRIALIVGSVRQINANPDQSLPLDHVPVHRLWDELRSIFSRRLAEKDQTFVLHSGHDLVTITDAHVLENSVLGNFLSNAIKFSPRGSTIEISARPEDDASIRIQLINPGAGFPPDVLEAIMDGRSAGSRPGTESEIGAGSGLQIAHFYLKRLSGKLEIRNVPTGAIVSIILPAGQKK